MACYRAIGTIEILKHLDYKLDQRTVCVHQNEGCFDFIYSLVLFCFFARATYKMILLMMVLDVSFTSATVVAYVCYFKV